MCPVRPMRPEAAFTQIIFILSSLENVFYALLILRTHVHPSALHPVTSLSLLSLF